MLKPALASAILALAVPLPAQTVPSTLPVEGRLTLQGGGAVDGIAACIARRRSVHGVKGWIIQPSHR